MHKKYHKKFKILGILAVTTQAREGIETPFIRYIVRWIGVTTQAREGIETLAVLPDRPLHPLVTTQAREGIETHEGIMQVHRNHV